MTSSRIKTWIILTSILPTTLFSSDSLEHIGTTEVLSRKFPLNTHIYTLCGLGTGLLFLCHFGHYSPKAETFKAAYLRPPEWDNDSYLFNYILHPLWGSETYLRARENGYSPWGSFIYSMSASAVWEYLFESWIKHPSQQDLIFTTGIGWIIGELRLKMKQKRDGSYQWLIDPLYFLTISIGNAIVTRTLYSSEYKDTPPLPYFFYYFSTF